MMKTVKQLNVVCEIKRNLSDCTTQLIIFTSIFAPDAQEVKAVVRLCSIGARGDSSLFYLWIVRFGERGLYEHARGD